MCKSLCVLECILFFFFFDCSGSLLLLESFSLAVVCRGSSPLAVHGLLITVASLIAEQEL